MHLFAGAGGGILGDILLGHHPVCAVEIDTYCQQVLSARQKDGCLPWFPIFGNVTTFDGKPWRGLVDVVSGGFPCTDLSAARTNNDKNGKQRGIKGPSSGLWTHQRRIIGEVQPRFAFIENSPQLRTRGLSVVLRDLAAMGFNARWGVLGGRQFGADHIRERFWIVATNTNLPQREGSGIPGGIHSKHADLSRANWWKDQPDLERVADGMAAGMDAPRLRAIGNGQIPAVAALAWRVLSGEST